MNTDKPKSFCGIFGVFGTSEAAFLTYYGLHSLQHRGQEASGIVTAEEVKDKVIFNIHKNLGLVSEVFHNPDILKHNLKGFAAIGHNRYSTTGASESLKNIQPFVVNYRMGHLAVAHNGNLTNAHILREDLVNDGAIFQTTSDTEVILHLIARSRLNDQVQQILEALRAIEGAYCLVILTEDKLIAARDPYGFRPLALGQVNGTFVVASETCALDINSAKYIRDIEPGELIVIDRHATETKQVESYRIFDEKPVKKQCIFEYIYFSRPDSKIFGHSVDKIRRKLGKVLAKKHPVVDKDGEKVIVISVPDSSNTAALGYTSQLEKDGIRAKFEIGLIRSHYVGRTFIQPGQSNREMGVRFKFNIVKGVLENRTVVLIDDSIVRGTTSRQLISLIKEANPKAIHVRISSPPIVYPCYYGMDFPSREELIANKFDGDVERIREYLDVDSLEYLTNEELLEAMVDQDQSHFCTACFSGIYPTKVNESFNKNVYED
ncbi:MAG: amidophosphoribosyltransferase [Ignavibacteria bacterium]|nr:amidophosphoribosyltransferase [Ignavibacteria bacterium]HEX2961029.1 amidophosphoribosyltransferase [Ignavibacteriales bacterium]MCU7501230.1 amidophosphoribosyltransferase [Ignavibacteria bacterium]MCU7513207.1 amidophosphoribosyltransferase [Ignavibacteria bacterium]MCU7521463.1 amidophosphoribosyltransferase [Ignavibacteria bacterium]